jgi:hypothetical protein
MPDSVNRIVSSPVAPERYPIRGREREKRERKEHEEDNSTRGAAPSSSATQGSSPSQDEQIIKSDQGKTKGKILDVSV